MIAGLAWDDKRVVLRTGANVGCDGRFPGLGDIFVLLVSATANANAAKNRAVVGDEYSAASLHV